MTGKIMALKEILTSENTAIDKLHIADDFFISINKDYCLDNNLKIVLKTEYEVATKKTVEEKYHYQGVMVLYNNDNVYEPTFINQHSFEQMYIGLFANLNSLEQEELYNFIFNN